MIVADNFQYQHCVEDEVRNPLPPHILLILIFPLACFLFSLQAAADINSRYRHAHELMADNNYDHALTLLDSLLPSMPKSLQSSILSDMAVCYKNLGIYHKADDSFRKAIATAPSRLRSQKISYNYSNYLLEAGDYAGAVDLLMDIDDPSLLPDALINLSLAIYLRDNELDLALPILDECLEIPDLNPQSRTIALQNKGHFYLDQKQFKEARNLFAKALHNVDPSPLYYNIKGNIAIADSRLLHHSEAKKAITEILDYFSSPIKASTPDSQPSSIGAKPSTPTALPSIGAKPSTPTALPSIDYRIALRKAGEIYLRSGDKKRAGTHFKDYFHLEKEALLTSLPTLTVTQKLNLWQKEKELLSKCFMLEEADPEFLFEVATFRRLISLLAMQNRSQLETMLSTTPAQIRASLRPGEVAVEFISYTDLNDRHRYAAIVLPAEGKVRFVPLFDTDAIYARGAVGSKSLFTAISDDDPTLKNILYSDLNIGELIWRPIINALPATKQYQHCLEDKVRKNDGAKPFTPTAMPQAIFFAPEGIFHLLGIENLPFKGKANYTFHRLTSTASLINRDTDNIRPTSSSDSLSTLPHHRSLVIGGLNYSSLPSPSSDTGEEGIDNITDIDHEAAELIRKATGRNDLFSYLPGTKAEADSVSAIVSNSTRKYRMSEDDLKRILPDFEMVHIATHGYSLNLGIRKRPEFLNDSTAIDLSLTAAGVALTGANVAHAFPHLEDGILSAREICSLDLSNVDFVVLSACQSAQGDITDEGAAGLVRGLKNAGVHTVMASLWSVDDNSTMLFMQEFYRLLDSGLTKHEAYLGAQHYLRSYRKSTPYRLFSPATLSSGREIQYRNVAYDAPFYWAPFILIDDI